MANDIAIGPPTAIDLILESRPIALSGEPPTTLEFPALRIVGLVQQLGQISFSPVAASGPEGPAGPASSGFYMASGIAGTNAVTATSSPTFGAYPSDGIVFIRMPTNSTAVTLALNGLAARAVTFANGGALSGGEFNNIAHVGLRITATTFEIASGV